MTALQQELKKNIQAELENASFSIQRKKEITASLDGLSELQLMELHHIILIRDNPELLKKEKADKEKQLVSLKTELNRYIPVLENFLKQKYNVADSATS